MANESKVHAKNPSEYQKLAALLFDDRTIELVTEAIMAEEIAQRRPIDLMYHFQSVLGAEAMANMPTPGSTDTNNPDLVQYIGLDPNTGNNVDTEVSTYKLIWWQTKGKDMGVETSMKIRMLNNKQGRTADEDVELERLKKWEQRGIKKVSTAFHLYFKQEEVLQLEGVGCYIHGTYFEGNEDEPVVVSRGEAENLSDKEYTERGIWFEPVSAPKPVCLYATVTVKGKHGQETIPDHSKITNLAVSSFLKLNTRPFDEKTNPNGMKGQGFEALRDTLGKDAATDGGGGQADATLAVVAIRDDATFSQYALAMLDYLRRVTAQKNWKVALEKAPDEKVMELYALADLFSDQIMPIIEERGKVLTDKAEKAAGNRPRRAAA